MTMFLITTAIDLLFPSTESHFMRITECMKSKHLLLMKHYACIIAIPWDKLKNQSIIARKFKFCSTGRSCFTWFLLVHFPFNVNWKLKPLEEHNSTSPSAAQVKNWQKTIITGEKLDVISGLVKKMSELLTYGRMFRCAHGSVCTLHNSADRIKESAKSGTKVFVLQDYHSLSEWTVPKK